MGTVTPVRTVIIGNGLVGGSIALALRANAPETEVVSLDRGDDLAAVGAADLVVLAAPVLANIELLSQIRGLVTPATLITDVSSTKAAICRAAAGMSFVGGHPIAGASNGGRENARADLFHARHWILVRGDAITDPDVTRIESFVRTLGANPLWMDAHAHDDLFAFLSHLPQLTISALMSVVGGRIPSDALALAGAGLRDSTRLASSPADVWTDIVATNRPAVRAALDALIATLERLRDDEGEETLQRVFAEARAGHGRLQGSV